jgi:hypothetical protein
MLAWIYHAIIYHNQADGCLRFTSNGGERNTMLNFIQDILTYFDYLFRVIHYALTLNPDLYNTVATNPRSSWLVLGVVFLGGASVLLGQSVVLFVNRVRRGRFLFSLALNGVMYIISYFVWGVTIAVVGHLLFDFNPGPWAIVRMVGLSTAPLIFGFFILIPWMGPFIGRILNVWGFLILVSVVEFGFQVGLIGALSHRGAGVAGDDVAQQCRRQTHRRAAQQNLAASGRHDARCYGPGLAAPIQPIRRCA